MFVSRAATAVILFGLLRLYLGQLQLSSCLDCYVCILRNLSCFLIWIVTFVSLAIKAVFLFGLLRLYLSQFKLFSYLDCYVGSSAISAVLLFGLLRLYLAI